MRWATTRYPGRTLTAGRKERRGPQKPMLGHRTAEGHSPLVAMLVSGVGPCRYPPLALPRLTVPAVCASIVRLRRAHSSVSTRLCSLRLGGHTYWKLQAGLRFWLVAPSGQRQRRVRGRSATDNLPPSYPLLAVPGNYSPSHQVHLAIPLAVSGTHGEQACKCWRESRQPCRPGSS